MAANASLKDSEDRDVKVDNLEETTLAELIAGVLAQQRIPCATYRLQFNAGFTLRQAEALVSYLNELGITDCYASPLFKARAGSSHGYDICDHSRLNPEIGSELDFQVFTDALRDCGIGLILDVVPNHMSISSANAWWLDVLETGPSSPFAAYFDINWHSVRPDLENKVLLPILEDQYGKVLESGKLRLIYEDGAFSICYYDTKLPLAPRTYSRILEKAMEKLDQVLDRQSEHFQELLSILTALSYLPPRTEVSPERIEERFREKEIVKKRFSALSDSSTNVRSALEETIQTFNGVAGEPRSFDLLDALIDAQPYRPAFWRVAAEEINYRRFFDINELAAIRVEIPEVFEDTHRLLFRLLAEGRISGLRIDHPDGLWDPPSYFRRLQENYLVHRHRAAPAFGQEPPEQQDQLRKGLSTWLEQETSRAGARHWPLYVVAEKILSEGEALPSDWAIDGTTGYDFLNDVNGIFVDSNNRRAFDKVYRDFIGPSVDFDSLTNSTKKMIMLVSMAGEVNALAHELDRISEKNRWYRDFTLNSLTFALREVIACLPVYRTYISRQRLPSEQEKTYIRRAITEARRRNPRTARAIFDFIEQTWLLTNAQDFHEKDRPTLIDFVMKVQQITGPVTAKGVEDTAFYIFNRLVSLNEVGGNPAKFGTPVEQFHQENIRRLQSWPHSLLATSTHDTKRGEDVRARVNVLSEIPGEWNSALRRWARLNAAKKTSVHGTMAPDSNDEYLFYQTLMGAWPAAPVAASEMESFRERIMAYMLKATKEAKVHTSWINPDEEYDGAVQRFVREVLTESKRNRFLKDFQTLQQRVAAYGWINALAQLLLKLTCPGVPDIYQGSELWNLSLVDPDNRRPVDYDHRRALLNDLKQQLRLAGQDFTALTRQLLDTPEDGRVKLYLTYQVMNYRRSHQNLFSQGAYTPLLAVGEKAHYVCSFIRELQDEVVVIAVPRLVVGLTGGRVEHLLKAGQWGDTSLILPGEITGRNFHNLLTGERVTVAFQNGKPTLPLATLFQFFPVTLLA
ncbi:MAG TPA: malto-oligosyltrehalose synthase [Terriglobia bacterium]|nr:malto-oligosyltrehalose synthase [Terriglobia bacterium]